jgi:hypothetical protein
MVATSADTDYDGKFDFYFAPGTAASSLALFDMNADCNIGTKFPIACGNLEIVYDVFNGVGAQEVTDEIPSKTNVIPAYHTKLLARGNDDWGGTWRWRWKEVLSHNAIAIEARLPLNGPSYQSLELFGEKVSPLKVSSAKPIQGWLSTSPDVLQLVLPVVLGKLDECGTPLGSSVVVDSVEKATALLSGGIRDNPQTAPIDRLRSNLLAAKLNVAWAARVGDPLEGAYILGTRVTVRKELRRADRAVALWCPEGGCDDSELGGDCALAKQTHSPWNAHRACMRAHRPRPRDLAWHATLTGALNGGEVVYGESWRRGGGWHSGKVVAEEQDDGEMPCGCK